MNSKIYQKYLIGLSFSVAFLTSDLTFTSCVGDLDQVPHAETTSEDVYTSLEGFEAVMGKIYNSMTTRGQARGYDKSDLSGEDYMRTYFNMQELGTDEVASTWMQGENTTGLTYLSWDANDPWVSNMYYRIFYNIALCNEFLRNCTDDKVASLGGEMKYYRAEARTMRAMFYLHALDLYRNIPFVDETSTVGSAIPPRYTAAQVFDFVEKELREVTPDLHAKANCPYGRISQGAAQTLLARLYLNSEVWTGTPRWSDCITACQQVIAQGYTLEKAGTSSVDSARVHYRRLFNADNHLRTNEIIFALPVDPDKTESWGASTYVVIGQVSSTSTVQDLKKDYGVNKGWGEFRARGELPNLWISTMSVSPENDGRYLFVNTGQTQYIDNIAAQDQSQGYFVKKWSNLTDAGEVACNTDEHGVTTDYPLMRLADVYLMYAEAVVRGGGDRVTALGYINNLRQRAYGNTNGDITDVDMTADFILDERGRELYWEGYRRTDLVRYGRFTGGKNYQWRGGTKTGTVVDQKYNYYPIPSTDLTANPNLSNPEY